jgi:hypothetical protein
MEGKEGKNLMKGMEGDIIDKDVKDHVQGNTASGVEGMNE